MVMSKTFDEMNKQADNAAAAASTAAQQAKSAAAAPAADIEAQLRQINTDLANLAKTVAAYGAERAEGAKAKVGQVTSEAVEASQHALETIRADFASIQADIVKQVRAKPLQTIGIAAGAGFLLALATRR